MVVIGIFATLVDHCLRSIFASSRIQSSIFLVASGISAGTLILLTDPACYSDDMELKCSVGDGAFYSIGSTVLYFISSLLLSWIPLQAKDQHNEDLNFVTQTRTSSESKSEIFEEPTFAHADTIHTEISPGEIFSENV
ncbi:unnamed protein product [Pseudo-nitzschia multistriata]|uniref:Uncharacterized protein n=1 Tax=Pseudo-nitzschia multistriata TaxID=183589 RepID=A0A448ZB69_9STRA|nr:unnamed protein product [Pseudo-nitzschia multistriata]